MGFEKIREEEEQTEQETPTADEFGRGAAKVAVAQICESVGFHSSSDSALESLSDSAINYILELGKAATFHANLTNRTECNVFDLILALEDINCGGDEDGLGSVSSSDCAASSGKLRGIIEFVERKDEIAFSQPLPRFPVLVSGRNRRKNVIPSFEQMAENPPGKHIPVWLPAFPDPHTYKFTPMWVERESDPRGDKVEQARQRRKAERALLSLQQRLVCNGLRKAGIWGDMDCNGLRKAGIWGDMDDVWGDKSESRGGPLLEVGDRDEGVADGNGLSVVDAFAPAIEAAKGEFYDDGDGEKREKRPVVVRFKLRTGKKLLEEPLDLSLQKKGEGRPMSFVREEDRDDKRRRAEFILRQCMENPLDLNQL